MTLALTGRLQEGALSASKTPAPTAASRLVPIKPAPSANGTADTRAA